MEQDFDVFLSYSSKDRDVVRRIAGKLRERGLRPWLDIEDLIPGRSWLKGIQDAILAAPAAAVFVGPDGLGPWEEPEMEALLLQRVKRKLPVIPVLLPGVPAELSLPAFLQSLSAVSLYDELAVEDLIWGITGSKPTVASGAAPNAGRLLLPEEWRSFLQQCQDRAEREIRARISHKYIPALYVPRTIDSQFLQFLASPRRCFLVIDKAGSGKTNLLCHLALEHAREHPVVFLPGKVPLSSRFDLEREINYRLGGAPHEPLIRSHLESAAALERPVLIFIDGINENNQREYLKEGLVQMILDSSQLPFRFVISCRDLFWSYFQIEGEKGDFWWEHAFTNSDTASHNFHLREFSVAEFQQAKEKYFQYFNLAGYFHHDAEVKCRHPLLLRFFCEAHGLPEHERQKKGSMEELSLDLGHIPDIRLKTLFDTYWERKLDRIVELDSRIRSGEILERFLYNLATRMRLDKTRSLGREAVIEATGSSDRALFESVYTRIYDEDIILEEEKDFGSVTFVYEEFLEYTMARQLFLAELDWRRKDAAEIAVEIQGLLQQYRDYNHIESVLQYLLLWIEDTQGPMHLNVMELLLATGDQRLARIICTCVPKYRAIGNDVLRLMKRLMKHPSPEIRREVVDSLGRILHRQPRKVYALLKRLSRDRDWFVQYGTVLGLGYQGDVDPGETTAILHRLITSTSPMVRQAVAAFYRTEVGRLRPEQALRDLETLVEDPEERVQRECLETAKAFLETHTQRVLQLLGKFSSPWVCRKVCDALVAADLPEGEVAGMWELLTEYVSRAESLLSEGVINILSQTDAVLGAAQSLTIVEMILEQKDPKTFNRAVQLLSVYASDGTARVFKAYEAL